MADALPNPAEPAMMRHDDVTQGCVQYIRIVKNTTEFGKLHVIQLEE